MFVLMVLYTASIFQGLMVVQMYAEPLFAEAIPSMSPTVGCVVFAAVTVTSGIIAAFLIDYAGRRVCFHPYYTFLYYRTLCNHLI